MKQRLNIFITAQSRSGHNFIYNQLLSWNKGDLAIMKMEGVPPHRFSYRLARDMNQRVTVDHLLPYVHLIVVRDLPNWFASYMTWIVRAENIVLNDDHMDERIIVWAEIAMEALNETGYLENKLVCNYSSFKRSRRYRKGLCKFLEGKYSEDQIDSIPLAGHGSSFDRYKYQGEASRMKTDQRYREIQQTPLKEWYLRCLARNYFALEINRKLKLIQ